MLTSMSSWTMAVVSMARVGMRVGRLGERPDARRDRLDSHRSPFDSIRYASHGRPRDASGPGSGEWESSPDPECRWAAAGTSPRAGRESRFSDAGVFEDQLPGGAHRSAQSARAVLQRRRHGGIRSRQRSARSSGSRPQAGSGLLQLQQRVQPSELRPARCLPAVPHQSRHAGDSGPADRFVLHRRIRNAGISRRAAHHRPSHPV